MEQQQERNNSGAAKTGTRLRMFVSFGLGTMLLATMLVACGDSADTTATTAVATAVVSNVKSSPSPSSSAAPVIPFVSASPSLPSGSARPSASSSALPFLPSASPSSSPSVGAVAPNSDGACPATHPVKAGQIGPLRSYAVSGDSSYDRMRATECFATEAEAETAGYRKSTR